jgi:hypothetical protein
MGEQRRPEPRQRPRVGVQHGPGQEVLNRKSIPDNGVAIPDKYVAIQKCNCCASAIRNGVAMPMGNSYDDDDADGVDVLQSQGGTRSRDPESKWRVQQQQPYILISGRTLTEISHN